MRLPNGYGSVIKLKGKRRKPYAVRTSEIAEFVEIDAPKDPPSNIRRELNRYNFKWKRKAQMWAAIASLMDDVGANDVCIKLIMGHSMKNDITKGTYTHKSIQQLIDEVNKI